MFDCRTRAAQAPKPKAPKAEKPASRRRKPEKKPAAKEPAAEEGFVPEDTAVAAILATKPTTPAECVRAAKTLVDLGHPDVAKPFLKKVLDAKLGPQQLADLGVEFGVPMFLDLAGRAALLPEAKQLADAVAAAVTAKLEDAKRIAGLIGQLQDPSAEKRMQALAGLQEVRRAALGPLLAVLADPKRTAEYANVRTVLAGMGRPARDALVAVLDGADPKLKVQAILTLAEMNDPKVAIDLLWPCVSEKSDAEVRAAAAGALKQLTGRVPTRAEAIALLHDAAKTYFDRRQPIEGVADGQVELWRWDEDKRQCVVHSGTPADAARELAARFAREAYTLAPEDREIRLLFLTAMLDAAAYRNGLDRPLDEKDSAVAEAKQFGAKLIDEVLAYAHGPRASGGGSRGGPIAGRDRQGRRVAVSRATRAGGAAGPGGARSRPPAADGRPGGDRAIEAHQAVCRFELRAVGVGFLRGQQRSPPCAGRRPEPRRRHATWPVCWRRPASRPTRPPAAGSCFCWPRGRPTTSWLGSTFRSTTRRLTFFCRSCGATRGRRCCGWGFWPTRATSSWPSISPRLDPMAKAFARPHDDQACRWQLEQLATLGPQEFVAFDVRQRQAADALDLLAELSRSAHKLYDLRRVQDSVLVALHNPKLAAKAAAVLANLNSAESQRALVEVASRFTLPLGVRQAAATAFCENVQQHGILLTTEEIRAQYRRYNESGKLDAATRHVLGLILDCLEVNTQTKK